MYYNFTLFSKLAERAYKNVGMAVYSLDDILRVFRCYFQKYEDTFKDVHPNIRVSQIENIINKMPYIDNNGSSSAGGDITPDCYEVIIDKHFKTQYRSCDYNINHFFSGDIRLLRYYETLY
jgi:hypothetical protein